MTDKKKQQKKERNSVTRDEAGSPKNVGKSVSRHGENMSKHNDEPGREAAGTKGKTERPVGKSTARDSTSIDPQDSIDPNSPNVKRGGG